MERRRMLFGLEQEEEEMKEWKLLCKKILEETAETVAFVLPEGTNEVSILSETMQERSDGENLTGNASASIEVNGITLIGGVASFSGYQISLAAFTHIENLGAYIGGSSVVSLDRTISRSPVYPCAITTGEINEVIVRPQYKFVSGYGNTGRFSAGSSFTVYYR